MINLTKSFSFDLLTSDDIKLEALIPITYLLSFIYGDFLQNSFSTFNMKFESHSNEYFFTWSDFPVIKFKNMYVFLHLSHDNNWIIGVWVRKVMFDSSVTLLSIIQAHSQHSLGARFQFSSILPMIILGLSSVCIHCTPLPIQCKCMCVLLFLLVFG